MLRVLKDELFYVCPRLFCFCCARPLAINSTDECVIQ